MGWFGPTYHKACKLQEKLYNTMLNPKTNDRVLAQLATAWERLEERKRVMRMKPKPKDIDVSKPTRPKGNAPIITFREPTA
jgi:hypothetical protein